MRITFGYTTITSPEVYDNYTALQGFRLTALALTSPEFTIMCHVNPLCQSSIKSHFNDVINRCPLSILPVHLRFNINSTDQNFGTYANSIYVQILFAPIILCLSCISISFHSFCCKPPLIEIMFVVKPCVFWPHSS